MRLCNCKECKKMRRKGKILGTRIMGFWLPIGMNGKHEYYLGPVSEYVPFPRFEKGKRERRKKSRERQRINNELMEKAA